MTCGKRPEVLRVATAAALAMMLTACGGYQSTAPAEHKDGYGAYGTTPKQDAASAAMAEQWGVQVLGIRTTADGYMLDFRYRVLDAAKAAPLLDRRIKPQLVVEKSNVKLTVPVTAKLGALRQTTRNVKEERNYFVMFANPGRHVQTGDRVKVTIGDFATDELVVM